MTPFRLGLTGSIGMGKSTTAKMFSDEGIPVWDADATVHLLYSKDGAAVHAIGEILPDVLSDGAVSRPLLRAKIADDPALLDRIQAIVHPLVAQNRADFLKNTAAPIVVLDIPLLFETGAEHQCDAVAVVSVPALVQRQRVFARGDMTEQEYDLILSRQMPDAEKRARATWVIDTSSLDTARAGVRAILADIRQRAKHA
jgi:dephospho-CoA kinase